MNATISWYQDSASGLGYVKIKTEYGNRYDLPRDEPITSASNGNAIAALFGMFESIKHEGGLIYVGGFSPSLPCDLISRLMRREDAMLLLARHLEDAHHHYGQSTPRDCNYCRAITYARGLTSTTYAG